MSESRHLFLTGFRGTGKSTVGVVLAERLGRPLIDLDQLIEERAGLSIREIFQQGGEPLFRDLESASLEEAVAGPASVISLGGGAILRESNRQRLAQSGVCFWLDADPETIFGRLSGDASTAERRPALTNLGELEEIRELLQRRRPLYEAAANYRIETAGKETQEVSEQILACWLANGGGAA